MGPWLLRQIQFLHQGAEPETGDLEIVRATIAHPGVVRRRPVGSSGRFTEHAALPSDRACEDRDGVSRNVRPKLRTGRARLVRRLANAELKGKPPAAGRARKQEASLDERARTSRER